MSDRIYFHALAAELGIEGGGLPPMGEKPSGAPPREITHPNVWRKEGGQKLLAYLKAHYAPGDALEFDGHADCWLMLAMMDQMRDCQISTYIGAGFDRTLPIVAYKTGGAPAENQPCTFTLEEFGDYVYLTVHLRPNSGPFDLYFGDIVAPEISPGKNIVVHLDGRHLLFTFPVALTYGKTCRSIIMDYDHECFVSVSNTPNLAVGDLLNQPLQ